MDPNNSDSTNQPPQDTAPADANQPYQPPADQNQPIESAAPPVEEQNTDQGQQAESPLPAEESTDQAQPATEAQPAPQDQPTDQPADDAAVQEGNYIDDVGGSVVDLLDDIDESEDLVETVAKEMKLDKQRVRTILDGLLTKIDQGQLTIEELALIMAAPVVDEVDDEPQQ